MLYRIMKLRLVSVFVALSIVQSGSGQKLEITNIEVNTTSLSFEFKGSRGVQVPSLFFQPKKTLEYRILYRPSGVREWQPLTKSKSVRTRSNKFRHTLQIEIPDQDSLVGVFDFDVEILKSRRIARHRSLHNFSLNLSSNVSSSPFGIECLIPIWRFGIVTDFRTDFKLFSPIDDPINSWSPGSNWWQAASDTIRGTGGDAVYLGFATLLGDDGYDGFGVWVHGGATLTGRRDVLRRYGTYDYPDNWQLHHEWLQSWSLSSTLGVLVTFPTPSRYVDGAVGLKVESVDRFPESLAISLGWAYRW